MADYMQRSIDVSSHYPEAVINTWRNPSTIDQQDKDAVYAYLTQYFCPAISGAITLEEVYEAYLEHHGVKTDLSPKKIEELGYPTFQEVFGANGRRCLATVDAGKVFLFEDAASAFPIARYHLSGHQKGAVIRAFEYLRVRRKDNNSMVEFPPQIDFTPRIVMSLQTASTKSAAVSKYNDGVDVRLMHSTVISSIQAKTDFFSHAFSGTTLTFRTAILPSQLCQVDISGGVDLKAKDLKAFSKLHDMCLQDGKYPLGSRAVELLAAIAFLKESIGKGKKVLISLGDRRARVWPLHGYASLLRNLGSMPSAGEAYVAFQSNAPSIGNSKEKCAPASGTKTKIRKPNLDLVKAIDLVTFCKLTSNITSTTTNTVTQDSFEADVLKQELEFDATRTEITTTKLGPALATLGKRGGELRLSVMNRSADIETAKAEKQKMLEEKAAELDKGDGDEAQGSQKDNGTLVKPKFSLKQPSLSTFFSGKGGKSADDKGKGKGKALPPKKKKKMVIEDTDDDEGDEAARPQKKARKDQDEEDRGEGSSNMI